MSSNQPDTFARYVGAAERVLKLKRKEMADLRLMRDVHLAYPTNLYSLAIVKAVEEEIETRKVDAEN